MDHALLQIDAFTDHAFGGNPAAVCLLDEPRDAEWMQRVAAEMNLSETAFVVARAEGFGLRWFTPVREVDLCGHATLASAYILFHFLGYSKDVIEFDSRSGPLLVTRQDEYPSALAAAIQHQRPSALDSGQRHVENTVNSTTLVE